MEKDIGKIKKNDNTDIIIRIDDYGGRAGVTIREFVTGDRYTGFTKAGTRIPADSFEDFKKFVNDITAEDLLKAQAEATTKKPKKAAKPVKEEVEDEESEEEVDEESLE
jgi:hypothetical protein